MLSAECNLEGGENSASEDEESREQLNQVTNTSIWRWKQIIESTEYDDDNTYIKIRMTI